MPWVTKALLVRRNTINRVALRLAELLYCNYAISRQTKRNVLQAKTIEPPPSFGRTRLLLLIFIE